MAQVVFNGIQEAKRGTYSGFEVTGNCNGKEWKQFIFGGKRNEPLLNKFRAFSKGDLMDVKMVKNGRFWNVEDVKAAGGASSGTSAPSKSSGGNGNYRDPSNVDRSAALMIAKDMIQAGLTHGMYKKSVQMDLLVEDMFKYADKFNKYISGNLQIEELEANTEDLDVSGSEYMDDSADFE